MKRKLLIIITIIISVTAGLKAQPVITTGLVPPPGTFSVEQSVDATGLSEGGAGANQTWDFSAVVPTDSADTSVYLNASSTEYGSLFPSANVATYSLPVDNIGYVYVNANSNFVELDGLAYDNMGDTLINNYTDPERLIEYPATYNSQMTDQYESRTTAILGMGFYAEGHTIGTVSYVVDAYGTLTTPAGSCTDVLRFKRHTTYIDSTFINGSLSNAIESSQTDYQWSCASMGPSFTLSYDTTTTSSGTTYDKSATYTIGTFTAINKPQADQKGLSLYPNPVNDFLTVEFQNSSQSEKNIMITNMLGSKVYEAKMSGTNKLSMDVSFLHEGVYFISSESNGVRSVQKFVKQ